MVFFTIIIPSYNRANYLKQTIYSVLEQTHFHFELIIVDDGSTDNTGEVVQPSLSDKRVQYYKTENAERGAARNFGVKHSVGDYITFLDSDDIFLPWHLHVASEKIKENNNPPIFHLAYEMLQPDGTTVSSAPLPSPVNDELLKGNFLSCIGIFLRKDLAQKNLFDEDRRLSGSEDYELWLRIAARVPILTFPEITSRIINHDDRSVMKSVNTKLIARIQSLEDKLNNDKWFVQQFGDRMNIFKSFNALYLALHLAIAGEKMMAFRKLLFSMRMNLKVILTYRFIVAMKKTILW